LLHSDAAEESRREPLFWMVQAGLVLTDEKMMVISLCEFKIWQLFWSFENKAFLVVR
jgi:hypothetical protein